MATLFTLTTHVEPTSPQDILLKIKEALDAAGWTITDWRTNCGWTTNWSSFTDSFLQVKTTGYGNQDAIYRFVARSNSGGGTTSGQIAASMTDFRYPTYSTGDYHPLIQNTITPCDPTYNGFYQSRCPQIVLPSASSVKLWIFATDKFCGVTVQVDATHVTHLYFGVPDLIDPSWPGGQILWHWSSCYHPAGTEDDFSYENLDWDEIYTKTYSENLGMSRMWMKVPENYDSGNRAIYAVGQNLAQGVPTTLDLADLDNLAAANYAQMLIPAPWSGIRPMIRDILYYYSSDENIWRPFAYSPYYWCYFPGLAIGGELSYGVETFTVTPVLAFAFIDNEESLTLEPRMKLFPGVRTGYASITYPSQQRADHYFGLAFRTT